MRKLFWEDIEVRQYAIKCLTAAWNVRYNTIHCMANLVSGLSIYYVQKKLLYVLRLQKSINYFIQRKTLVSK